MVALDAGAAGLYVAGRTDGTLPGQTSSGGIDAFATVLSSQVNPNTPPVNTVPQVTLTVNKNTSLAVTGISVADPDAGTAPLQLTLTVGHGTLLVKTEASGGLKAGDIAGNGTGTVVLTGSQAQINATLAAAGGLIYTPSTDFVGTDTLTVLTSDLGNTGSGGALTDTDSVTINVLATLQQVSGLIAQVRAYMAAGILTNGQGTSIINSALKKVTETTGIAQIDKFIADIQKLVQSGKLSQANADPLLQAAYAVRAGLTA